MVRALLEAVSHSSKQKLPIWGHGEPSSNLVIILRMFGNGNLNRKLKSKICLKRVFKVL